MENRQIVSDLEMTKLCAEAMGLYPSQFDYGRAPFEQTLCGRGQGGTYDPLHDNAQAMALVKRFYIAIREPQRGNTRWFVSRSAEPHDGSVAENSDLNRAIVECVAKMLSDTSQYGS